MFGLVRNTGYLWLKVRVSYNGHLLIDNVYKTDYNAARKNPAEVVAAAEKQIRRNARRMIKTNYIPERLIVSVKRLKTKA